ncbi:SPOR domain-containing protein [Pseudooceanicola nitratireducens]|nr:SPOR domain-containing protein [Pseudooceanicola nitratireducens]
MTDTGRPGLRLLAGVSLLVLATACTETGGGGALFTSNGAGTAATGGSTRLVERDVEAPEVFEASEAGLWDGRPSLGGVWVAHPDVSEPERALIRNTANNKFVIGALFKPSLDRAGPRFQVSSDAAEALGMLAGQPVNIQVTALRREEVPTAPATVEPTPAPQSAAPEPAVTDVAPSMPAPAEVETATLDAGSTSETAMSEAGEPAGKKKRRWFWQKKDAVAETTVEAGSDIASGSIAPADVQTATLDAAPAAQAQTQAQAPAPVKPAARPAKPASTLAKPYLQIGIFSVEQNAQNTAVAMRQAGMIPNVLEQSSQGKTFWRVTVGPATTTDERAALLKKVKAAGFTDAYAVTN